MQSAPNKTPKYRHPPIMEAIIELRINGKLSLKDLEKIVKKLKKRYPNSKDINQVGIHIGNASDKQVTVSQQPQGFRLSSDNQSEIAIISAQSIAVACLSPYPGWEAFQPMVVECWEKWKSVAKTQSISRIGVRYINRIDIPIQGVEQIELEDYLTFYPKVPSFSDSPIENYLIQITKCTNNPLWTVNITSTIRPPTIIGCMSLLLDIDVYRTKDIPLNDAELWSTISDARELKNNIFKSLITNRTEEIFSQ